MTICPYKIAMIGVTVLLGVLVAFGQIHNDEEQEQKKKEAEALAYLKKFDCNNSSDCEDEKEDDDDDDEKSLLRQLTASKKATERSAEQSTGGGVTNYFKGVNASAKASHPRAYRASYLTMISLLVLFHFEIFSGGAVCRFIFASHAAADHLNATVAAADAAMGIPPGESPPVGA